MNETLPMSSHDQNYVSSWLIIPSFCGIHRLIRLDYFLHRRRATCAVGLEPRDYRLAFRNQSVLHEAISGDEIDIIGVEYTVLDDEINHFRGVLVARVAGFGYDLVDYRRQGRALGESVYIVSSAASPHEANRQVAVSGADNISAQIRFRMIISHSLYIIFRGCTTINKERIYCVR